MTENTPVLILLATYNGEPYIRQQIDSLLEQSYPNIRIILSDDGSSDETPGILETYAQNHPDVITHYRSGQRFGCAQKHFMHLLEAFQDAPYIMFCDQDDVWHPNKVSTTLQLMKMTEDCLEIPVLVHTDLKVVDKALCEIAPSFCAHSGLDGNRLALNQLLVQNVVTGCTIMVNSALARLACRCEPPEAMRMHDWWLALLSACCGKAAFLDVATIDYRQHSSNSVGAKNVRSPAYLLKRLFSKPMREGLTLAAEQADAFLDCYGDLLCASQRDLIGAFASTKDMGLFARDYIYIKHDLLKSGFIRCFSQLMGL